jgi:polyphenol oxidase
MTIKDTETSANLQRAGRTVPKPFPDLNWLRGGMSLEADGGMSWNGFPEPEIAENHRRYFNRVGLDLLKAVGMEQVHGCSIYRAARADAGRGMLEKATRIPQTDGLITNVPGLILTALHADCAPIFFADPEHKAIGVAHSGWKGTVAGIAGNMVRRMAAEFGTDPRNLRVYIGPTISTDAYEVPADRAREFISRFGTKVVLERNNRFNLDLVAAIQTDLLRAGLNPDAIPSRPPCTASHPEFSSYRRDGEPVKSMLSWLVIK